MKSFVKSLLVSFCLLSTAISSAQSTSVFDANYFNKENTTPPIKIGKGFHINDIYRQTRSCFTPETCDKNKLTPQQTGGKKTSIRIFYTKTNQEYNDFRSKGSSGKVSFLNLFTMGGQKLEEYANTDIKNEERLVFAANVDFGMYSFDTEPALLADAKALLDQGKIQDFVKYYGTHFISGIRKESTIYVILTKTGTKRSSSEKQNSTTQVGTNIPYRGAGSLEVENGSWTNKQLDENNFSVSIEILGPAIEQGSLKGKINALFNENKPNKATAIADIIESAIEGISDPNQSYITQYYYTPFTLYGVDGINWDEKKQNQLTKINEAVIKVYSSKTLLNELMSPSGKEQLKTELVNSKVPENYINQMLNKYNQIQPDLAKLQQKANELLKKLEDRYVACSDVYCSNNSTCCNNDNLLAEVSSANLEGKIQAKLDELTSEAESIAKEMSIPECEKLKKGTITIINTSINPYDIYNGDNFIETIPGKTTKSYNVDMGTYNFRAVQRSGYMMYATVNNRSAKITAICQEVTFKIGFED